MANKQILDLPVGTPATGDAVEFQVAAGGAGSSKRTTPQVIANMRPPPTSPEIIAALGYTPADAADPAPPGGAPTQVQYNNSGVLGGDTGLTYDDATNALNVAGPVTNGALTASMPVHTDASKRLISKLVNLAVDVEDVLPALSRDTTGTAETITDADDGYLVTFNNASPVDVDLDESGFVEDNAFRVLNLGAGAATITPSAGTFPGGFPTLVIPQNATAEIRFDGTNWQIVESNGLPLRTGLADGRYSPVSVIQGVCGYAQSYGDVNTLGPVDNQWKLAAVNAALGTDGDARGIIAIVIQPGAVSGDPCLLMREGFIRANTAFPTMTRNKELWLASTSGDVSHTPPGVPGDVRRPLGFAVGPDEIYFDPSQDWAEVLP